MILRRTYTYILESQLTVSFGKVTDRERKHPGEEASQHQGASGKEASGIRGTRALGRRVARAFLGLFTILGPLALGPGPIEALELGRLARGTEPGPMVPTIPFVEALTQMPQYVRFMKDITSNKKKPVHQRAIVR